MLDEGKNRLVGAWIEAFDGERPELDRVRLRTRVVERFEASRPRPIAARWAFGGFAAAAIVAAALVVTRVGWWSAPTSPWLGSAAKSANGWQRVAPNSSPWISRKVRTSRSTPARALASKKSAAAGRAWSSSADRSAHTSPTGRKPPGILGPGRSTSWW